MTRIALALGLFVSFGVGCGSSDAPPEEAPVNHPPPTQPAADAGDAATEDACGGDDAAEEGAEDACGGDDAAEEGAEDACGGEEAAEEAG